MLNVLVKYIFLSCMCYMFSSCNSSKYEDAIISENLIISSCGVEDNALWVICTGHNDETIIVVNGQLCQTTYANDHLTCVMPKNTNNSEEFTVELYNKKDNLKSKTTNFLLSESDKTLFWENNVVNATKIQITGYGFGDEKSIWILCKNHSSNAKILINGFETKTEFYENHLTAYIPKKFQNNKEVVIQLTDAFYLSPEFILSK